MKPYPPDEKIGPFEVRARPVKGAGFSSVVNEAGRQLQRFDGFETEALALEAARAYAREQAAMRRPPRVIGVKKPKGPPVATRSLDDLRAKFLRHFPGGFADETYVAAERAYKLDAREKLGAVDVDAALNADAAACETVKAAFSTNMLSPFENARVRKVLEGGEGPAFLSASARFARGDAGALADIDAAVRPHGAPSWTIATYLPALWTPETNAFLRIKATQTVAAWLGHDFAAAYRPQLEPAVYAAYLDLAQTIRAAVSDLGPRDMIDVQSFIWVAADYA